MAKVVAFLCLALLVVQVAQVESARLLRGYDDAEVTAQTFPSQDTPDGDVFTEVAVPTDTEYNYNNRVDVSTEEATADEGVYATEGILVGETVSNTPPEAYVFDAQHDDEALEPVFNPSDTTTQDFDSLDAQVANEEVVQPAYDDPTSLAVHAQEFEFQESTGTDDGSRWDSPGFFAFDDSLPSGN